MCIKVMEKKLAFCGDCNGYGYKIIRILEELGGINVSNYGGTEIVSLYYIDEKNRIKCTYNGNLDKEKYVIMTYHDFISKYPFQVGDTVYSINTHEKGNVFEIAWDEKRREIKYYVDFENSISWISVNDIFCYEAKDNSDCGTAIKPMKVKSNAVKLVDGKVVDNLDERETMNKNKNKMKIVLAEFLEHIKTTPKEELEREFEELEEWSNVGPTVEEFRTFCECVNRKPKYPDNYEECVRIAKNIHGYDINIDAPAYRGEVESFIKLLICRDAYWKIAGEQMGLGKPWKHNYLKDANTIRYAIYNTGDEIVKLDGKLYRNYILCFPTEEMRDAFYDNFKDLIEQCKELL